MPSRQTEELRLPGVSLLRGRRPTILLMVFALTLIAESAAIVAPYAAATAGVPIESAFAEKLAWLGFGALVGLVGNAVTEG